MKRPCRSTVTANDIRRRAKSVGGSLLGEGKTGRVTDVCKDIGDFCLPTVQDARDIAYLKYYSMSNDGAVRVKTLSDTAGITKFLQLTEAEARNLVAKKYRSYWRLTGHVSAENEFLKEIRGVSDVLKSLGIDIAKACSPIKFIEAGGENVLGMCIKKRAILEAPEYVTFFQKCERSMEDACKPGGGGLTLVEFIAALRSIIGHVCTIQEKDVAHGDLKPANMMECAHGWKLIDWNMAYMLDWATIQEKDGLQPAHRGSSPMFYMLHNVPFFDAMIDNYVKDFMMAQFYPDKLPAFRIFMKRSVKSYWLATQTRDENITRPKRDQFDLLKYNSDLHSLGIFVYAISAIFFGSNERLSTFAERLCVCSADMILTAEVAKLELEALAAHGS